jgi:hypothetical protein
MGNIITQDARSDSLGLLSSVSCEYYMHATMLGVYTASISHDSGG